MIPVPMTVASDNVSIAMGVAIANVSLPMGVASNNVSLPMGVAADNVTFKMGIMSNNAPIHMKVSSKYDIIDVEEYMGPFEATPTTSTQQFATAGKYLARNITINPIPSNYGLITWNGTTLTVS